MAEAEARLRAEIKSEVVFVKGSGPAETVSFMGTIILVESRFCYVVVDRAMARNGFSYEATLPDGSVAFLSYDQFIVGESGRFAAFYIHSNVVNYNENMINAVQFEEQEVSRCDSVRLADFDENQHIFFPGARVNDVKDHFFMVDWLTKNIGAPVFNEAAALVGICYKSPLDPSYAYTVSAIKNNLLDLSDVPVETVEEFLDRVRLRGSLMGRAEPDVGE